jgi:WhiB family redox-sensing transcriptional regulator
LKAHRPWDEPGADPDQLYIRVDAVRLKIETHGGQPWRTQAECTRAGAKLRWFFPDSSLPSVKNTRLARGVCARCPVKRPCLSFALTHDSRGIWAGATDAQRAVAIARFPSVIEGSYDEYGDLELIEIPPTEERIDWLLAQVRLESSTGPFRSTTESEWEEMTG